MDCRWTTFDRFHVLRRWWTDCCATEEEDWFAWTFNRLIFSSFAENTWQSGRTASSKARYSRPSPCMSVLFEQSGLIESMWSIFEELRTWRSNVQCWPGATWVLWIRSLTTTPWEDYHAVPRSWQSWVDAERLSSNMTVRCYHTGLHIHPVWTFEQLSTV